MEQTAETTSKKGQREHTSAKVEQFLFLQKSPGSHKPTLALHDRTLLARSYGYRIGI